MKYLILVAFAFFSIQTTQAQTTVGVLTKTNAALDGYTFFSPFSGTKAYMIDNCGNLINEWDRGTRPGLSAYFLDNGLMLRTYKVDPIGPFTSASNAGGIELVDWNNNVVWNYVINTSEKLSHHDAVMMPNGNMLILTWELTYGDELIRLGRNPNEIAPQYFMWSEKILELEPVGSANANIVWQWHINDHYIQDYDDTKDNFGVVSEHPELFDINHPDLNSNNSNASRDWNHFNAIDYNEALDQILISVRNSDEIWILDHSTTTAEARGHTGGRYGKGGDILYRWGNPSAYKNAPLSDQMLWGQHGTTWIDEGLDNAGQILIYNNGNGKPGTDFSQVQILSPPQDSSGFYSRESDSPYGPRVAETIYGDMSSERFYSAYLSNAQRLVNNNILINAGSAGRIFEVTPNREIVWEYEIPLFGDFPATQGDNINNNSNFRAYKYSKDFKGFDGIDISAGDPIEVNPKPCELTSVTEKLIINFDFNIYVKENNLIIEGDVHKLKELIICDVQGKVLAAYVKDFENIQIGDIDYFGVCFVILISKEGQRLIEKILLRT
ncbi:MAG: hypothetical protein HKN51_08540 [Saprospiraceae bacterium]|nr:hypothetical protein [Saprospiraceae bacterium]